MESSRWAVPLEELEAVHVADGEQVQEVAAPVHPDASAWSGPQLDPHLTGGGGPDADGD